MSSELAELEKRGLAELEACADVPSLRAWHTKYLGDNGELKAALKKVGTVPKDQRAAYGQQANQVKETLTTAYESRSSALNEQVLEKSLAEEVVDVTLPGRPVPMGRLHIATRTLREIYAIFADMGFQIHRSPEVETDEENFELLNMPPHHRARDMWDTFHTTTPGVLLRTHTSPGQIDVMKEFAPNPVR